ncbi:hypothetical protein FB45DRAFT_991278 [Roridomyces roridus]|uniref:SGNH hydrolase-type esterase domain-containing protein n=1 Tax=Roridomyces roridus TaxID=1738132 RepID=A0AAD7BQ30_9AGAR|nr:hypothetical protein FB45DRAFT_991278 [Roridomyces roridus]
MKFLTLVAALLGGVGTTLASSVIPNTDPLIFFHGRWDTAPETWWSGSGFKLNVANLTSLTINLGPNTTLPSVALGVSIAYQPFFSFDAVPGANVIPLPAPATLNSNEANGTTVVRINAEMYFSSQMNLESIVLNEGAHLVPYVPSAIAFEFIGDSFSTETVVAQPGAALTDIFSYGNVHGMSFQFFQTEDTSYFNDPFHNYTTPWNFSRDVPERTHVVVHIGANDAAQGVTQDDFVQTYLDFLATIRVLYPTQPFFIFTPWGWPNPEGPNSYYYPGAYPTVVEGRQALGDNNLFIVDTTGWVTYADVYPDSLHPSVEGHMKIAGLFQAWLENWGLEPLEAWSN